MSRTPSLLTLLSLFLLHSLCAGCASNSIDLKPKYTSDEPFLAKPSLKPARITPLWHKNAPPITPFASYNQEASGIAHLAGSDSVIVARNNGKVTRYRAANGRKLWEVRLPHSFFATPVGVDQTVFLPSLDGTMLALDAGNGTVRWQASYDHSFAGQPAANQHVVVALDAEDVLYCWDADSGKLLWQYANERNNNFTVEGTAQPILLPNSVIAGFADGQLIRFNLMTGEKEWSLDLSDGKAEFADVDLIAPAQGKQKELQGTLFAATRAGGLSAIEESNGRVLWRTNIIGLTAFDVTPDAIYVATTTDHLYAVNPLDGSTLWTLTLKNTPTSIVNYGYYLVVATGQGSLYLIDGKTGYPFQKWNGFPGLHAPLTYAAERIYLHGDHGSISAYKVGW